LNKELYTSTAVVFQDTYGKRSLIKEEPDQEHEHDELAIIDLFKESSYQIEQNPNSAHQ
jgi:hypothetical protein